MSTSSQSPRENLPEDKMPFAGIMQYAGDRFQGAVALGHNDARYEYFTIGMRRGAVHSMGVFCVSKSLEPLVPHQMEQLLIGVPISRPDTEEPQTVIGMPDAKYLYLTYLAPLKIVTTLRIDETVYEELLLDGHPQVIDLGTKMREFDLIPMREKLPLDDLTD